LVSNLQPAIPLPHINISFCNFLVNTNTPPRCPTEDGSYCFNYGECFLSRTRSPYCKCLSGFAGPRCRIIVPKNVTIGQVSIP